MDRSDSRRHQSASGRAGTDVRRRPLSSSRGTSPRAKRPHLRDQSGSESHIPADTPVSSDSSARPDPQSSMNNDECVMVSPRSSRFLFAGSRDRSRAHRRNGSGRMGRERRWRTSPIVVLDDDSDEDAVVVEATTPPAGPSFPRHLRRSNSVALSSRTRQTCPPSGLVDITLDSSPGVLRQAGIPQEGRRHQQERRAPPLPPLRRTTQASSALVPMGRPTVPRRRSGSYPRLGNRAQGSRAVERQIAEDEQLARRLQEREMGERHATSHPIHEVLQLLDSSSDDDDDSDDSMFMFGYPFGTSRITHRGRSSAPSLFPVVSLLDTLQAPLISHLEFFDSDSEDDDAYEHLVQLGEALGEVVPQGLTALQIAQLPTRRVVGSDLASDKRTCHICLEDFKRNNIVRTLPCLHEYHKGCLDKWLKRNSTCPLCRKEALE
ncbi:E3 ubiquitin-protein ligase RLIM-like isoform X2 [Ornithodoros turicata]|uniref:E3 ubiquitin-protein ligase RLIM-like isoform X2 n=1 Tax=Ornithodoros turicata TaxID=34597 RepID=UPI003138F2E8